MAGDRGDDLAGVQRAKRSGVNGTPVSSSSGPVHVPVKEMRLAIPGHGNGPLRHPDGAAGLSWLFGIAMKAQP